MKDYTNFTFHMYTEDVFGKGTENRVGELVKKYGGSKVMIVYGGGSVKKSGLYDRVVASLDKEGIRHIDFGGVKANPTRSFAYKGIELAKKENIDFVLGIGGASAIDTGKGIALAMVYDGDVWDFYSGKVLPKKMMPVGTIHTISAAGSENSGSTVLVDDIGDRRKIGTMWPDVARPVFAIMNPELTYSVPAYQKGAGAADAFAHTLERYLQRNACSLADEFAFAVLRNLVKYAKAVIDNPSDYEAHAEIMLTATFAHNDVTSLGRAPGGFTIHGLEINLSGRFDTTHGAGIGLVMPPWLTYIVNHGSPEDVIRVAQLAVHVFGVIPDMADPRRIALDGIQRMREWLRSIGMPLTLTELGVKDTPEGIAKYARANPDGVMTGFLDLDKKAVAEIFTSVR
ncbi:MAG: iron-containing alcohol dehydrogenase [Spirochaetaceae bacterium]|nr:iron-containing alcohol dehydrogenase [Spirochaetaceae bacterium]